MKEYFSIPAISNSAQGAINPEQGGHPQKYLDFIQGKAEFKSTLSLERGSLLHLWVESPEKFLVEDFDKPTGQLATFIESYYEASAFNPDEVAYQIAYEAAGCKRDSLESMIKKFNEENSQKYLEFIKVQNREDCETIAVTKSTKAILDSCKLSIVSNETAASLLLGEFTDCKTFNELPIFWESDYLYFKALLDRLIIDFENKVIFLIDLKTTSKGAYTFKDSFEYYHYYRQMGFYKEAIKKYCEQQSIDLKGWKFRCKMVVCETGGSFFTTVYDIDISYLSKGKEESQRLIELIRWHNQNSVWSMTKAEYENAGCLTLKIDDEK